MRSCNMRVLALEKTFCVIVSAQWQEGGVVGGALTWMIWSSFFTDSLLGPESEPGALGFGGVAEPRPSREASLELLVRAGLVWGEAAGDEAR